MPFHKTNMQGLLLFEPKVFGDERGYFFESYHQQVFAAEGLFQHFVQDNEAFSRRGVLRGLHYQTGSHAQAKLVRVLQGEVLDVVVDLRPASATFGQVYSHVLSQENKLQLFIPRGFAHGYVVRSETARFFYKCDNFYAPHAEGGIHPLCPKLAIDWGFSVEELTISDRDLNFPDFDQHKAADQPIPAS